MGTYFMATVNVPGYQRMEDDPPTFDTISEAWNYLADERKDSELMSEYPDGTPLSDTYRNLLHMATIPDPQTGSIYGVTPGYEGDHDLGLAYNVDKVTCEYSNARITGTLNCSIHGAYPECTERDDVE